jgi:serine/threonine protein kinase
MEFHLLGNLRHFMWFKFPEEHVRLITSQILVALDLVHDSGFVYGALEPSVRPHPSSKICQKTNFTKKNIFVIDTAPRWWVKLGDFGLSKKAAEVESFRTNEKSLLYLPPEERKRQLLPPKAVDPDFAEVEAMREAKRGKMIDVWATGALAFRLLTNQALPEDVDGDSSSDQFPRQMLIDLGASEACIDFLDQLLSAPSDKRLSSSQALALPWIGRARE